MQAIQDHNGPSQIGEIAQQFYETNLKGKLEAEFLGKAVAIHVDSGDYEVGETHRVAARKILGRHQKDGRIVTLTIGPPTDQDIRLATRLASGRKQ
jgi:hypothetical protein